MVIKISTFPSYTSTNWVNQWGKCSVVNVHDAPVVLPLFLRFMLIRNLWDWSFNDGCEEEVRNPYIKKCRLSVAPEPTCSYIRPCSIRRIISNYVSRGVWIVNRYQRWFNLNICDLFALWLVVLHWSPSTGHDEYVQTRLFYNSNEGRWLPTIHCHFRSYSRNKKGQIFIHRTHWRHL